MMSSEVQDPAHPGRVNRTVTHQIMHVLHPVRTSLNPKSQLDPLTLFETSWRVSVTHPLINELLIGLTRKCTSAGSLSHVQVRQNFSHFFLFDLTQRIVQGDSTSPSERKSVLNILWKYWC